MADTRPQHLGNRLLLPVLVLISLVSFATALRLGSIDTGWHAVLSLFHLATPDAGSIIVTELRLPRAVSAFVAGGLLALAGALMQVLLRNPLADPYILGTAGGAAVGALLMMLLGLGALWINSAAFCGALLSTLMVFSLSHYRGSWTPTRLLLTGVVIATGWGALISFLLAITPADNVRGMLFWLMGDLSSASNYSAALVVLIACLFASMMMARNLNVLSHGELQARSLGVNCSALRMQVYILSSLATAVAVTLAGSIGFVGLIVPHFLRLVSGNNQRLLLPATVLCGGSLVLVADTLARTVIAPQQLPVGVLMALIGVPVFLYLLNKRFS
jgi:iron complex transport system permease protein